METKVLHYENRVPRSHAGIRIMSDLKWAGGCDSDYVRAKKKWGNVTDMYCVSVASDINGSPFQAKC